MRDLDSDDNKVHDAYNTLEGDTLFSIQFIEINLLKCIVSHTVLADYS